MVPTESNLAGLGEFLLKHMSEGAALQPVGDVAGHEAPVQIMLVPKGLEAKSVRPFLEEYRQRPDRREGTAVMQDLDSFIALTNRFKDDNTALFADASGTSPSLLAVLDYHERVNILPALGDTEGLAEFHPDALPRFGRHRVLYEFPLSDEWKAWTTNNGRKMTQTEFASFLEDRGIDILPPPTFEGEISEADAHLQRLATLINGRFAGPERLMDLSRSLAVHENAKVAAATNLSSGEGSITFETEHTDSAGQKLEVPNLFCVAIPVFEHGARYRVVVRLRYRKNGSSLNWFYDLYRADTVFDDALRQACAKAREETGLPLFLGKPEVPRTGRD